MPYIPPDLARFEYQKTSQFGEDGVVEAVAKALSITSGTFFEFGIGPPIPAKPGQELEGNFVQLRDKGWAGVFIDGKEYPPSFDIRREFITALNINQLMAKHAIPTDVDFMSIDVDGQEFWIWMALAARPKVLITEINGGFDIDSSKTIQFDINHRWDGTLYHGASLRAFHKLAQAKGYTLVWGNGVNAMFVQDAFISNKADFSIERAFRQLPFHAPDPLNRTWVEV